MTNLKKLRKEIEFLQRYYKDKDKDREYRVGALTKLDAIKMTIEAIDNIKEMKWGMGCDNYNEWQTIKKLLSIN